MIVYVEKDIGNIVRYGVYNQQTDIVESHIIHADNISECKEIFDRLMTAWLKDK